jgi:hypothetical protein
MAPGIEEGAQSRFDSFAFGQQFLGIDDLVAARFPCVPLALLIETERRPFGNDLICCSRKVH